MQEQNRWDMPIAFIKGTLRDTLKLSLDVVKIMVPVVVLVKILQELDLIRFLAKPLGPLMQFVGLPDQMGLVWATAMLISMYSAVVILFSLVGDCPLTAAQTTILCTLMLMAHCLPMELKIAQKAGARLLFQGIVRIGSALLLGWFLHITYSAFDLLQGQSSFLFEPSTGSESLLAWAMVQARGFVNIFFIIFILLLFIRLLDRLKVTNIMNRWLEPVLKTMGIGPNASTIAVAGTTLGIIFGAGLIIHEAKTGRIQKQDVFFALTLMGLSHGLFEDTLFMLMVGGHLSGILLARIVFSLAAMALLVRITRWLPESFCERFLWSEPKKT